MFTFSPRLVLVLGLGFAISIARTSGPALADQPSDNADLKAFQGNWKVYREEANGQIDARGGTGFLIDGDNYQFWYGGGSGKGPSARVTLRPSKEPKEIDLAYTSGHPGQKQLGIYKLCGRQLTIAWSGIGEAKRPSKFTGKLVPGAAKSLVILRHEEYREPKHVAAEFKRLEGRWVSKANKGDGLLIEGDHMVFLWGGNQRGSEAQFAVDPAKKVKQIEVIYTVGEPGKRRIGIYKLEGKRLTLSLSERDEGKRPTRFAPATQKPGGGKLFAVYIRQPNE